MIGRQRSRCTWRAAVPLLVAATLAAGCAPLGPDYRRPDVALPAAWKTDAGDAPGGVRWQPGAPADAMAKRDWWTIFADERLNAFEQRCLEASPTLQQAVARLDQARAQEAVHGAALLPEVDAASSVARTRLSANRPLTNYGVPNASTVQSDTRLAVGVSYEFDWLGRVRRDIEATRATRQQVAADLENVRLLLTAEVAGRYFQLRQLDEEMALLGASVRAQGRIVALTQHRYAGGAAALADVAQQTALAESMQAQLALLAAQRSQTENALGTLLGQTAADFRVDAGRLPATLPAIPSALPSTLLERRPDVASAERGVAAANAQIGVAEAAFYPALTLMPTYAGDEAAVLGKLFDAPSLIWSIGAAATQVLFDGGRRQGGVDFTRAGYAAAVAAYRQQVLVAVREVQDALDGLRDAGVAGAHQDSAVVQQDKAYRVSLVRYREGLDSALTLALNEQAKLAAERSQSQLRGSRFAYSVALVKALGGGWAAAE